MASTIDISSQVAQLNSIEDEIKSLKKKFTAFQNNINSLWVSSEMYHLNAELNALCQALERADSELIGINGDLVKAASEVNQEIMEEEARAAAEAEALAKAAEEAAKAARESAANVRR